MGWERRDRGGLYYVRKTRVGGRVVSQYVGTGAAAQLAAELDAHERAEREASRQALSADRERWARADAALDEMCEAVEVAARDGRILAGYHQHHRGEWRKRRGAKEAQPAS